MIYIDSREGGSNQSVTVPKILSMLSSHRFHPPVNTTILPAADFYFTGSGPEGHHSIGIERKRIPDLFSSLRSGRLVGEQFPKLIDLYDTPYLIVEGQARVDWNTGELFESRNGDWVTVSKGARKTRGSGSAPVATSYTGQELLGAMNTISLFSPVRVIRTFGLQDTLDVIATLWHWWQKPWDKHSTMKVFYTPQTTVTIGKASFIRRVAKEMTGIGWDRSGTVEEYFTTRKLSARDMANSGPDVWEKLPGFGKVLSKKVTEEWSAK
jgi:ERCC4-type nuclease